MVRSMVLVLGILGSASAALAQEKHALTPTDVLEFGQFSATGTFRMNAGTGTLADPTTDVDLDTESFLFQLDAAVGLGMGFEVELSIPWQFKGSLEGDGTFGGSSIELEQDVDGVGDLTLAAVYRMLKEDSLTPQWILGVVVVPPSSSAKQGQAGVILGGVQTQQEEDAAIGDGVWKYGFETGISKTMGLVEPYALVSYVFGGSRTRNGVRENRADVLSLVLGAEWHVTPAASIDTRAVFQHEGKDITEDNLAKAAEEAHWNYGAQVGVYINLGGGFTLVAGGAVFLVEDHQTNDLTMIDQNDAFFYQVVFGVHFFFGGL